MEIDLERIRKLTLHNLGFKIVSFIAAFALWIGFLSRGEVSLELELGLNYIVPPSHSLRAPPDFINIKLKGPEMSIRRFARKSRLVSINLTGKPPGWHKVHITRELLDLPPGVQVLYVRPDYLNLELLTLEGVPNGN